MAATENQEIGGSLMGIWQLLAKSHHWPTSCSHADLFIMPRP